MKPLGQPGNDNGWVYAYNTRLKALPAGKYSAEEFFEKVAAGAKAALALNDSPGQDLRKKVADAQVANPQVAGAQREPNAGEQK